MRYISYLYGIPECGPPILLPGGRAALIVGDGMDHGLEITSPG